MKLLAVASAVAMLCAGSAFAQGARSDATFVRPDPTRVGPAPTGGGACPTPPAIASLPFTNAGNTCGGTNTITNYGGTCGTNLPFPYPGPEDVYAITVGATQNVVISADLTGSTGDLALYLLTACGNAASCISNSQDEIGPGAGPENLPPITGQAAGTYFVYVDSYYGSPDPASCGSYTLNATGTLPVELESFQIN